MQQKLIFVAAIGGFVWIAFHRTTKPPPDRALPMAQSPWSDRALRCNCHAAAG